MEHSNIPFTSCKRRQPSIINVRIASNSKDCNQPRWSQATMHGISFLRTLTYPFTLPTHRKTMENPSVIDIKTVIYQPAKSQQRTRPSRQYICPEPLWRQKPKWAATPTPGLILRNLTAWVCGELCKSHLYANQPILVKIMAVKVS